MYDTQRDLSRGIKTEFVQAALAILEDAMNIHHLQCTNSSCFMGFKTIDRQGAVLQVSAAGFWDS
jgi:hypothetical protein